MVTEKLFERVFESFAFIFLFVLVWSAVMGFVRPPAWFEIVAYLNGLGGSNNGMLSSFFGTLQPLFTSSVVPDTVVLSRLWESGNNGTTADGMDIWKGISFFVNLMTGGLLSIILGAGLVIVLIGMLITYFVPMVTALAFFFAGSFPANMLRYGMDKIDWASQSGWLGYPDQVSAALRIFAPIVAIVG